MRRVRHEVTLGTVRLLAHCDVSKDRQTPPSFAGRVDDRGRADLEDRSAAVDDELEDLSVDDLTGRKRSGDRSLIGVHGRAVQTVGLGLVPAGELCWMLLAEGA
jgi:hypothetical protein